MSSDVCSADEKQFCDIGGASNRFCSTTLLKSLAKRHFPGEDLIPFNYYMGSKSEKREYHGVFSIKDNGCYRVIDGKVIRDGEAQSPHTFLKLRHIAKTSSGLCREYSVNGIIMVMDKTLAEWKKLGEPIRSYPNRTISRHRLVV